MSRSWAAASSVLSLPIAAVYEFAILPSLDGLTLLMLVLAPLLLGVGTLLGIPSQYSRAMPLLIGVIPTLSLTAHYQADFAGFINSNIAQLVGALAALGCTALISAIGAEASAWRIVRRGWQDLADMATRRTPPSRAAWTTRMLDRVGLLLTRLPAAESTAELGNADALIDLRIGLSVIDLQKVARSASARVSRGIEHILGDVADYFRARARGLPEPFPAELLAWLDEAALSISSLPSRPLRREGLLALTSLRRNLLSTRPAAGSPAP